MSATKDWLMWVQEHPAYQQGHDAAMAASGHLAGRRPPEDADAAFAYNLGWNWAIDEMTPRPFEP